jgi:hypothetical protein
MADRGVLFYTYTDHLVFFTHYCVMARKHGIRVLSLCEMPDHVHDSVVAEKKEDLEQFKRETATTFSKNHNDWFLQKGPVLEGPFGRAPKREEKKARTNLVYVGNNPVERKLTARAEEYRWNYLAYAASDHPFSEKLVIRNARWPLQKAVKEVKASFKAGVDPIIDQKFQELAEIIIAKMSDDNLAELTINDLKSSYARVNTALHMGKE